MSTENATIDFLKYLQPKDAWDRLSIEEKSDMMETAIRNGITTLPEIRRAYNEFAEGGSIVDNELVSRVETEEGFNSKPEDIGDGKMTLGSGLTAQKWHDLYRQRGNKWSAADNRMAVMEELSDRERWAKRNIPNWERLPDSSKKALLSYKYNYDFTRGNSPKLFKALEDFNLQEAARQMDATSKNPKFKKGLQARRQREQNWFLADVVPQRVEHPTLLEVPASTAVYNPYIVQQENTMLVPRMVPDEGNYVQAHQLTESEIRRQKLAEKMEAIDNFNRMMRLLNVQNNPLEIFSSSNPLIDLANSHASGGGIHIKPSHRGRLTELKKRTGKTEAELYNDGNPAHRKMVVFARNSRKWKHGDGGNLFYPGGTITYGKPFYSYDKNGQRVDDTLNYNGLLSNINIIPDSQKTPVQRMEDERYRQRTQRDYAEQKSREYTERQIAKSQKEWDNSQEKALLDYGQAAATGVGIGVDMVSHLPIYSSLKGARVLSEAQTPMDYIEGGLWIAPIVGETINGTYQAAKPAVENFLVNHPVLYQYPRYAIGKFKYGFDAELPTLYRKVKTLPKVENGRVQISNPDNRFAYENGYGEESPVITNFTTDAPVRSHSAGNWDRGLTLAFPGRTLLGKHVISTRPSDTFTFRDNISVPVKDVTAFSGRPKEIASMDNAGVRIVTSPDAEMFWGIDSRDLGRRISEARENIQKINAAKAAGNRMVLLKPKMPIENFSNYSRAIEDLTRETFKSPTARDYQFMDYVFRPKYDSQVMPVINDITFDVINKYPLMGEWVGNTERLRYLDDPSRWQNLMYDPLTTAESDFRGAMNIGLKPDYKK